MNNGTDRDDIPGEGGWIICEVGVKELLNENIDATGTSPCLRRHEQTENERPM